MCCGQKLLRIGAACPLEPCGERVVALERCRTCLEMPLSTLQTAFPDGTRIARWHLCLLCCVTKCGLADRLALGIDQSDFTQLQLPQTEFDLRPIVDNHPDELIGM